MKQGATEASSHIYETIKNAVRNGARDGFREGQGVTASTGTPAQPTASAPGSSATGQATSAVGNLFSKGKANLKTGVKSAVVSNILSSPFYCFYINRTNKKLIQNVKTVNDKIESTSKNIINIGKAISNFQSELENVHTLRSDFENFNKILQVTDKRNKEYAKAQKESSIIIQDIITNYPSLISDGMASFEEGQWKLAEGFWSSYEDLINKQIEVLELQNYLISYKITSYNKSFGTN